jgi:hypothetical protein
LNWILDARHIIIISHTLMPNNLKIHAGMAELLTKQNLSMQFIKKTIL